MANLQPFRLTLKDPNALNLLSPEQCAYADQWLQNEEYLTIEINPADGSVRVVKPAQE